MIRDIIIRMSIFTIPDINIQSVQGTDIGDGVTKMVMHITMCNIIPLRTTIIQRLNIINT